MQMSDTPPGARSWRDSKLLAACEFAVVAALFMADMRHHIFFSKTPYLFLLAWTSLRLRGANLARASDVTCAGRGSPSAPRRRRPRLHPSPRPEMWAHISPAS